MLEIVWSYASFMFDAHYTNFFPIEVPKFHGNKFDALKISLISNFKLFIYDSKS